MNKINEVMFRWRVIWYFFPYLFALFMTLSNEDPSPNRLSFVIGLIIFIIGQGFRIWGAGYVEKTLLATCP